MKTVELLQIVLVPLAVVLIPVIWGTFVAFQRRRQFSSLVFREVARFHPSTKTPDELKLELGHAPTWNEFTAPQVLLHRGILAAPTENRDFILSLPATLIYNLNQLWDAWERGDWRSWLQNLLELEAQAPSGARPELADLRQDWCKILSDHFLTASRADLESFRAASPRRRAASWVWLVPIALVTVVVAGLVFEHAVDRRDAPRVTAETVQAAVLKRDGNPTATATCARRAYPRDSWLCRVSYLDKRVETVAGVTVRRGHIIDVTLLGRVRSRPG